MRVSIATAPKRIRFRIATRRRLETAPVSLGTRRKRFRFRTQRESERNRNASLHETNSLPNRNFTEPRRAPKPVRVRRPERARCGSGSDSTRDGSERAGNGAVFGTAPKSSLSHRTRAITPARAFRVSLCHPTTPAQRENVKVTELPRRSRRVSRRRSLLDAAARNAAPSPSSSSPLLLPSSLRAAARRGAAPALQSHGSVRSEASSGHEIPRRGDVPQGHRRRGTSASTTRAHRDASPRSRRRDRGVPGTIRGGAISRLCRTTRSNRAIRGTKTALERARRRGDVPGIVARAKRRRTRAGRRRNRAVQSEVKSLYPVEWGVSRRENVVSTSSTARRCHRYRRGHGTSRNSRRNGAVTRRYDGSGARLRRRRGGRELAAAAALRSPRAKFESATRTSRFSRKRGENARVRGRGRARELGGVATHPPRRNCRGKRVIPRRYVVPTVHSFRDEFGAIPPRFGVELAPRRRRNVRARDPSRNSHRFRFEKISRGGNRNDSEDTVSETVSGRFSGAFSPTRCVSSRDLRGVVTATRTVSNSTRNRAVSVRNDGRAPNRNRAPERPRGALFLASPDIVHLANYARPTSRRSPTPFRCKTRQFWRESRRRNGFRNALPKRSPMTFSPRSSSVLCTSNRDKDHLPAFRNSGSSNSPICVAIERSTRRLEP